MPALMHALLIAASAATAQPIAFDTCALDHLFPHGAVTERWPTALALADFDGDGRLDVVTGNINSSTTTVAFGTGTGLLGSVVNSDLPRGHTALRAADVTGDTVVDLVVLSEDQSFITIMRGLGDGRFSVHAEYLVAPAHRLLVGDINNDGTPDIVTLPVTGAFVSVQIGVAGGFYFPPVAVPLEAEAADIALGHIDGDAFLDLVVTFGAQEQLAVLPGTGTGRFAPPVVTELERPARNVLIADLNGDGHQDLVASWGAITGTAILLGAGDSTFTLHTAIASYEYRGRFAGDIDGDGNVDLVSMDEDFPGRDLTLWRGDGHGGFVSEGILRDVFEVDAFALGDFDHDGRHDLVRADGSKRRVHIARSLEDGTFDLAPHFTAPAVIRGVATADFTDDGHVDIAVVGFPDIMVYPGSGSGFNAEPITTPVAWFPGRSLIVHLLPNQPPSILTPRIEASAQLLFYTLHKGEFDQTESNLPFAASDFIAADLDHDGDDDLLCRAIDESRIALIENNAGVFSEHSTIEPPSEPTGLQVADLNGDGVHDIVIETEDQLLPYLANTPWTFEALPAIALAPGATFILVDVTSDALPDLVVSQGDTEWLIHAGQGDGTFTFVDAVELPGNANQLRFADFDGDGFTDIVGLGWDQSTELIAIALGDGAGRFPTTDWYPGPIQLRTLDVEDLDHDGRADIIITSGAVSDGNLTVLFNRCDLCPADLTAPPGTVDAFDLMLLFDNWTEHGPGAELAVPLDVVDFSDLLVLLDHWGPCRIAP